MDQSTGICEITQAEIDAQITLRLLAFHDALVERGQLPAPQSPSHCIQDQIGRSDPALQPALPSQ
jgi:hypothetical protein